MNRFLNAEIKNEHGAVLSSLIREFRGEGFIWSFGDFLEVYRDNEALELYDMLSADEALSALPEKYYTVFATVFAYPPATAGEPQAIKTYNDFLKSGCRMIVDINDCCFVRAFSDDERLLLRVLDALKPCLEREDAWSIEEIPDPDDRILG
ncbi:MAG: DUF2691 family protein [Clostridiales bacterium]|nr:DUF2691 family protein [Clostridiales bacterium]